MDSSYIDVYAALFGFSKSSKDGNYLEIVKNMRNQLAHGEITFSEAGRKDSIEDLIRMKDSIFDYMKDVLKNMADFISLESFKA